MTNSILFHVGPCCCWPLYMLDCHRRRPWAHLADCPCLQTPRARARKGPNNRIRLKLEIRTRASAKWLSVWPGKVVDQLIMRLYFCQIWKRYLKTRNDIFIFIAFTFERFLKSEFWYSVSGFCARSVRLRVGRSGHPEEDWL